MLAAAAFAFLLAAISTPLAASSRLLTLVAAAIRSAPQSVSPSPSSVRRMLGADLFAPPSRHTDSDVEWVLFQSVDGRCIAELGPVIDGRVFKLMTGCRFATRAEAIRFLHEMISATAADWRPPVVFRPDVEIAHIAVILVRRIPLSAEAYLNQEGDDTWRATIVLAIGGRTVVPTR